jgi:hypothetical protein
MQGIGNVAASAVCLAVVACAKARIAATVLATR